MKALKIVGIVLGSLVILILIFVGVAYALLNSTPATASKVTPVVASPEEAKQLDMKVDNFETTVKQAKPGTPVQLTLTQEEINSKIAAELSTADLPDNVGVSNVIVNLVDGEIFGSAKVSYSGLNVNVGIRATVEMVNGQPTVVVQNLDFGKLPVPQSVKDQITNAIPNDGKIDMASLPLNVQGVQIVDGQVVLSGITK